MYYFGDDEFDAGDVVPIKGLISLQPSAVAIVVIADADEDDEENIARATVDFEAAWPDLPEDTVVAWAVDGSGLGSSSDVLQLWILPMPPTETDAADIVVNYDHGDDLVNAASYLPMDNTFSVSGVGGATESATLDGESDDPVAPRDTPAVGSPGLVLGINFEEDISCSFIEFVCVFFDVVIGIVAGIAGSLPF